MRDLLCVLSAKAKEKLGWQPKYDLKTLAKEMYYSDLENIKRSIK